MLSSLIDKKVFFFRLSFVQLHQFKRKSFISEIDKIQFLCIRFIFTSFIICLKSTIYLSSHLPISLSSYLPIFLIIYLLIGQSIYLPIILSYYLPFYLSFYLLIYLSTYLLSIYVVYLIFLVFTMSGTSVVWFNNAVAVTTGLAVNLKY